MWSCSEEPIRCRPRLDNSITSPEILSARQFVDAGYFLKQNVAPKKAQGKAKRGGRAPAENNVRGSNGRPEELREGRKGEKKHKIKKILFLAIPSAKLRRSLSPRKTLPYFSGVRHTVPYLEQGYAGTPTPCLTSPEPEKSWRKGPINSCICEIRSCKNVFPFRYSTERR